MKARLVALIGRSQQGIHRGRPVAIVAINSHMPDIGGRLRGVGAREVFEEGIQIPLMKLIDRGQVN